LLLAAYLSFDFKEKQNTRITSSTTQTSVSDTNISVDDQNKIMQAYQQQRSNIQVQAQGIVKAVLPDDNQGSKHQKMILKLENGLTVLIAHNIDLAPRIDELKKGSYKLTAVPQISQEEPQLRFFLFSPFFIRHKE